jgi:hypothetical protein
MSDADRMLEEGSELERTLLRAGVSERPTEESMRTAARVLGFVPRAAVLAYVAGLLAKGLKSWARATVLAPAMAIAGATAIFYGAVTVHGHAAAHGVTPSVSLAPVVDALPPHAVPDAPPAAVAPSPSSAPAPSPSVRVAPVRTEAAPHDPVVDVRRQVAWIDHARSLAESGDTAGALQALDGYDRTFPHGVLSEESALLRIEAVFARGDDRGASGLARRFLIEHPHSVHAAKVRSLLDGAD